MKVKLRNPDRVIDVSGPREVSALLKELEIVPESVLVIRDATLLTRDEALDDADEVEIRPVLSGGSDAHRTSAEALRCDPSTAAVPERQAIGRFGTKGAIA